LSSRIGHSDTTTLSDAATVGAVQNADGRRILQLAGGITNLKGDISALGKIAKP